MWVGCYIQLWGVRILHWENVKCFWHICKEFQEPYVRARRVSMLILCSANTIKPEPDLGSALTQHCRVSLSVRRYNAAHSSRAAPEEGPREPVPRLREDLWILLLCSLSSGRRLSQAHRFPIVSSVWAARFKTRCRCYAFKCDSVSHSAYITGLVNDN